MKRFLKVVITALFLFLLSVSCEDDDTLSVVFLNEIPAASNLDATIEILDGNSRAVTVTPSADGAAAFNIFFGESTDETPITIGILDSATHVYQNEGTYVIEIQAISPSDITTSIFFSVDIVIED
ncbi:hypothetical protein [uncultured Dokdonia sp.]|uniref:hypothetical protein n=1 Tax=uncultured Dokdonia sp. TaxID=575653 RepID=UPI0026328627|nr:hypothetical protein [uncultured Dokdonia sp.]